MGSAAWGAGAACGGDPAGRRPRRRRDAGVVLEGSAEPDRAGSGPRGRAGWALRRTLAPTSPSAQSAPSAVCTSTRQTTIAVGAPPIGGRFWVSVQRA
jgi:hypothetical protein